MAKSLFSAITLLVLATIALSLGNTTRAEGGPPEFDRRKLSAPLPVLPGQMQLSDVRLDSGSHPVPVLLELFDQPTVRASAAQSRSGTNVAVAARSQLNRISQTQQQIEGALAGLQATVLFRVQRVYNGIAVEIDADRVSELAGIPGVKAVHRLTPKRVSLGSSVPLIGAPQLWEGFLGHRRATGRGMRIGIIDGGVDYLHRDFGGVGTKAAYEQNDTTTVEPGDGFPSAKVIGGYDFVGDDYNPRSTDPRERVPRPDPDPMECVLPGLIGHGTHVAGIAAGYGVNADGTTFRGQYDADLAADDLRIGPGVAPEASLVALRIVSCHGGLETVMVLAALDYAVDPNNDGNPADRLDVVNLSLGGDVALPNDPELIAVDTAVEAGVLVVAAAGNNGDSAYITSNPAAAPRAIAVASSEDGLEYVDGFRVERPANIAGTYPGFNSDSFDWTDQSTVTGELVYPRSQPTGCEPFDATNRARLAGKIALLDWTNPEGNTECDSSEIPVENAAKAGALGVIMVNLEANVSLGVRYGSPSIPMIVVRRETGRLVKSYLPKGITVTLSSEFNGTQPDPEPARTDTISFFSSRGPSPIDSTLKPDIAAPGSTILSANAGTGDGELSISGTSMATPHIAGAITLLRQIHPTWTTEELKALLMNTANSPIRSALPARSLRPGPARVGAGRVTLGDAATSTVLAYNADQPGVVSVSFGTPEVAAPMSLTRQVKVVNKGARAVTYEAHYVPATVVPGVSFRLLDGSSITIPPGGDRVIRVQMNADPAQMRSAPDPTVVESLKDAFFVESLLTEASGYLTLTPDTGTQLACRIAYGPNKPCPPVRVPLWAGPSPVASMHAVQRNLVPDRSGMARLDLAGRGISTGPNLPQDMLSLVTALELQATSADEPGTPDVLDHADLRYVGVASDWGATHKLDETTIFFGVATHGTWTTPNGVSFDIYIDTNRDGKDDFLLINTNFGRAFGGNNNSFITALINLHTGALGLGGYLNGVDPEVADVHPFNTNVMVLPVSATDLGLSSGQSSFTYRVETRFAIMDFRAPGPALEVSPGLTYDAARPGLDLSGGLKGVPTYTDLPGRSIPVKIDLNSYQTNRSQGLLLLHSFNGREERAEVVRVSDDFQVYLPAILR